VRSAETEVSIGLNKETKVALESISMELPIEMN